MDKKIFWEKILKQLSEDIPRPSLMTWFQNTCILSIKDNILTIGLPRDIFTPWHQQNSRKKIEKIAQGLGEEILKIEFIVDGTLENEGDSRVSDILNLFPSQKPKSRKLPKIAEVKIAGGILSRQLNNKFQLSNFVTGPGNRLAHAASESVAKSPGKKYNPLFIYGGVGLGKTHLLQSIGNEIIRTHPNYLVAFVSSENFMAEFIENIRHQKIDKFREKWRRADALIVDDIQFLVGKTRTEEFFFHLFNDLFDSEKQIVVSSDRPPSELQGMEKRLISRFSMGMIADLQFPELETRIAILQQKSQEMGVILNMKIMEFIAENIHHSVRELEGILTQIVAKIDLEGEIPTQKSVTEIIKNVNKDLRIESNHIETVNNSIKTMNDVVDKVSKYYSVTKEEILGSNRSREFLVPRQVAMWFCKKKLSQPYQKIGSFFGGRDHTSVMNSIKRVEMLKKTDAEFWRNVNKLRKDLGF